MAEVGTHDDLAAYEIQDVVGLEDATERGRGSFGAVYEVEVYGVPCVAKCLHDILIGYQQQFEGPMKLDEEGVDAIRSKFRDECTLHCQLRHPNIVQFLGVHYGMYSGELALIVERLQWDLGKFVEAYKEIPESIKVSFLLDVAYGLMYLHNRTPSVIHRDLSAGNVLISGEGKAKIADLGASKVFLMSVFQAHTAGQPGAFAYMPPEALQPNPQYDQSFDVFSFGAVALYTATQKFPFAHEIAPSVREVQNGEIQIAKRRVAIEQAQNSCLLPLIKNCLFDNSKSRPSTSQLCIELKQLASQNLRTSGDFSKLLGGGKDVNIILLKEEVLKLEEQTRSQLEFQEMQKQHILKMSADRSRTEEEHRSQILSLKLRCDKSAESLLIAQEEISHLKQEIATLSKEKNDSEVISASSEPGKPPIVDPLPRGAPGVSPTPRTNPRMLKTSSRRSGNHGNREPLRSVSEFNVGELRKGEEFPSDMNVYQQLLEGVTTERDELKRTLERVNARWDGKVKRLEVQLALKSVDTIAVEQLIDESATKQSHHETITRQSTSDRNEFSTAVQFVWQPMTEIVYPEIMLLASFEPGSVSLKLDSDGGHYASSTVVIPNGAYEGQLVIGDSFIYPVKKFTVNNSNDLIVLQFNVEQGKESPADSDLGVSTLAHYGTGDMQVLSPPPPRATQASGRLPSGPSTRGTYI